MFLGGGLLAGPAAEAVGSVGSHLGQVVVAPTTVSPAQGLLGNPGYFREPTLLRTKEGLVTAFMEAPPNDQTTRQGWSCISKTGTKWQCKPVSRGPGATDWADAWLADTRGDQCPTYGKGLTLTALRKTADNVLQPISYYSLDHGLTWRGPDLIPWPKGLIADGPKVLFNGRTFYAFRDFSFTTGQYLSRLDTDRSGCHWSTPVRVVDGQDHPVIAATGTAGELALRGNLGTGLLTFHRYDSAFTDRQSSVIAPVAPTEPLYEFCAPAPSTCRTAYDIGQTLLYDHHRKIFHAVFANKTPQGDPNGTSLLYSTSTAGGASWNSPTVLAGTATGHGYVIAEPQLAYDQSNGNLVLAYYEIPSKTSGTAQLRMKVLTPNGLWSPAITLRTTSYIAPSTNELRWGDYFGMQAVDGVVSIAHHPISTTGRGSIEYLAVRDN
jgi:hypothetical protein